LVASAEDLASSSQVAASDISEAMATEAGQRAAAAGVADRATFSTSDLEALSGKYDTVRATIKRTHAGPTA
jgi:cyclopropane fatty-acyl-phospholipid synthase-like methyltransferase